MKKVYSSLILIALLATSLSAQVPEGINYQAIARDASGSPLANLQNMKVKFSIFENGNSSPIYVEEHSPVTTNQFGLFNRVIGSGNFTIFGSFPDFSVNSPHSLKVEIDINDGAGYIDLNPQPVQFQSVPYALYAKSSGAPQVVGSTTVTATLPLVVIGGISAPTISLTNSGVTAGTYGSATTVPSFTVNSKGLITNAADVTITSGSAATTTVTAIAPLTITGTTQSPIIYMTPNSSSADGYVTAPASSDTSKVWGTDSSGNPGWITPYAVPDISASNGLSVNNSGEIELGGILNSSNTTIVTDSKGITINAITTSTANASLQVNTSGVGSAIKGSSFIGNGIGVSAESSGLGTALKANSGSSGYSGIFTGGNVGIGTATPNATSALEVMATAATHSIAATFMGGAVGIGTNTPGQNASLSIKDGHLETIQTAEPTISVATIACYSVAATNIGLAPKSTDMAGQFDFKLSSACGPGQPIITVLFDKPYPIPPIVTIAPVSSAASTLQYWVTASTLGFSLTTSNSPLTNVDYKFNYIVIGSR